MDPWSYTQTSWEVIPLPAKFIGPTMASSRSMLMATNMHVEEAITTHCNKQRIFKFNYKSAYTYKVKNLCWYIINTLRRRQNFPSFADHIFKCIFLTEDAWISLKISFKFIRKFWINNIPTLPQVMAWRRPGEKPLSEAMMVSSLTHVCGTRGKWVNMTKYRIDFMSLKRNCFDCQNNIFYR